MRFDRGGSRFVLALTGLFALAVACYGLRLEFYPLTAWHLYSLSDTSGKIKYYKVLGRDQLGQISSVRLEDGIGATALDGRYMVAVEKCFGSVADVAVCEKFLSANAAAYNTHTQPGNKLTHYEIQAWTWDFLSAPRDPNHGEFSNRFVVDVTGAEPTEKQSSLSTHTESH